MISKLHFFSAALAGLLACSVAGAQVRNGSSSSVGRSSSHGKPAARASANPMPSAARRFQSGQLPTLIQISPSGQFTSGYAPIANSFSFASFSGVPGLGFDFPHMAAVSGALSNSSWRFGRNDYPGQGSFAPVLFGGYAYYADDPGYDQQDQQTEQQPEQQTEQQPEQQSERQTQPQPQIVAMQQPVAAQQDADSGSDAGNLSTPESESRAAAPIRDVGDFILVRRDGRILFASVFSVVGSQLQYVTPEGIRHTLAMSDLDAGATQQMNEARGTSVQIHN